jgi:hypothetical protein
MAKKKKSQQAKTPRMPFRERFEQNVQKSIAKGNKWAVKAEKSNKVGIYVVFGLLGLFYCGVIFEDQPWLEKTGSLVVISVLTIIWLFIVLKWIPAFKEAKIVRGKKLIRYPVRTRTGHELRVRLLPKYLETVAGVPVLICFLIFFSLILGLISIACLRQFLIQLPNEQLSLLQKLFPLVLMVLFGVSPITLWRGYFWTRNHTKTERKLAHKPPKTTIEVSEHPLHIGREYEFWAEQQGNYPNCHLEFYMVMIKTECREIKASSWLEDRRECANYLVEVMEDDADIRPESPLRYKFTMTLDAEDYVPSVWYKYSFSNHDKFDWVLRVILISNEDVLVEREFPLVMVE